MKKQYIAIDLKSFYASAECVARGLDPLKALLVVADPTRTEKTICLAVSPALKAFGIPGRARLFEVNQKAEEYRRITGKTLDFIIAPPRMKRYIEISGEIYDIYLKYISPEDIHIYSIDEVFIDASPYLDTYKLTARALAQKMITDVLKKTGITATAGIGTNLYLAKIAMDIDAKHAKADENGVRISELDEISYRKRLWAHRPITDFWRTGSGTAKRLEKYGMYTMGDIARMSLINEELFYKVFGIDAEIIIDHAWGIEPVEIKDIKNYKTQSSSLSQGQVLSCPYSNKHARTVMLEMADMLTLDLVDAGLAANSITLEIGYDKEAVDNKSYSGKTTTDRYGRTIPEHSHGTVRLNGHTNSAKVIIKKALELFDEITDKTLKIRRMYIIANNVIPEDEVYGQLDIFTPFAERQKETQLQKAAIQLKKKYGGNAVLRGTSFTEGATARERNRQIGGHKA
ncbi:MAG: DNA methylase [Firmicutes bacterium]|nr:DNA methylase [Bacillota bacterium]